MYRSHISQFNNNNYNIFPHNLSVMDVLPNSLTFKYNFKIQQ